MKDSGQMDDGRNESHIFFFCPALNLGLNDPWASRDWWWWEQTHVLDVSRNAGMCYVLDMLCETVCGASCLAITFGYGAAW